MQSLGPSIPQSDLCFTLSSGGENYAGSDTDYCQYTDNAGTDRYCLQGGQDMISE